MAKKKVAPKKPIKAKPVLAKAKKGTSKAAVVKSAKLKPAKKTTAKPKPKQPTLGRPLVTAEEKLYMLFKEDYEARQVFEFLRVDSVGDLEKLSPEEIIRVLTAPVRRTVHRIRQRLAEKNRALQGDIEFALQHRNST
ncbi:hypothetical protein ETAA8_29200 [Anatilimnocola aggregata]|uniref:Uncharacterized protein n=1 Tax=Anatilimnocola aggregata TaxID=2528021 RepID=A0A517YCC3_9BACT|nr:hypothetical protein [Anatilimnocola aggregata]QDU27829.1 hypothetical protein ETAA8_29200 [Anatilimnocola aggregata]